MHAPSMRIIVYICKRPANRRVRTAPVGSRSGPDRVLAEKASSAHVDRECLRQLQREVPNVFGDFELGRLDDGTEIATSPFVTEG